MSEGNRNLECTRCHKRNVTEGIYCEECLIDLRDQEYLEEGSFSHINEETDRRNSGEYADLNEGNDYYDSEM